MKKIVTGRAKDSFGIRNEIVLQAYDNEWNRWVDLQENTTFQDHEKFRVATVDTAIRDIIDIEEDNKVYIKYKIGKNFLIENEMHADCCPNLLLSNFCLCFKFVT